jgi:predicted nuclease with TOPRIM domain
MMKERLSLRLDELRAEYEKGKTTLEELEAKVFSVRSTMLRISGAIQVLEEELGRGSAEPANGKGHVEPVDGKAPNAHTLRVPA